MLIDELESMLREVRVYRALSSMLGSVRKTHETDSQTLERLLKERGEIVVSLRAAGIAPHYETDDHHFRYGLVDGVRRGLLRSDSGGARPNDSCPTKPT